MAGTAIWLSPSTLFVSQLAPPNRSSRSAGGAGCFAGARTGQRSLRGMYFCAKRMFGLAWTLPKHEFYLHVSAFCRGVENSCKKSDAFERDWRDRSLGRPLHREMTFTQAGLVLGRGTLLAEFGKEGLAAGSLAFDSEEARILSLLTATFAVPVAPHVVEKIRRAGEFWRAGEKALAQIRLALMGLPKIDETGAYRLFLAATTLEKGLSPSDLMKALGFPRAARGIEKYWED